MKKQHLKSDEKEKKRRFGIILTEQELVPWAANRSLLTLYMWAVTLFHIFPDFLHWFNQF